MKNKILLVNLVIYLIYCFGFNYYFYHTSLENYQMLGFLTYTAFFLVIQTLVNLIIAFVYYLRGGELFSQLSKSYLLSALLLLVIGGSVCTGMPFFRNFYNGY